MSDTVLRIEGLEKSFGELRVLKGIDMEVHRGEVVTIIGASGSGKSTLLRCVNLLEEADAGHIWFDGKDLMDLRVDLNALRQNIGMVFQSFNLFNNKNVLDNCTLTRDVHANAEALAAWCVQQPELFSLVTTTIAPTMIEGGSAACNVLPQNMRAVVNFRLNQGETAESLLAHCREAIRAADPDSPVQLRFLQANDPSAIARTDGFGYRMLKAALGEFYPAVTAVPSLTAGATDAHQYERICDTCLRCSPFMVEKELARSGVHGTDEHIPIRSYLQGIRVLMRMMELCNT